MLIGAGTVLACCIWGLLARCERRYVRSNNKQRAATVLRKWPRQRQWAKIDEEEGERGFPPELMYSTRSFGIEHISRDSGSGADWSKLPAYDEAIKASKIP